MADDNTPTVTARRRKPTKHMRLRMETVKRLRALGAKRKAGQKDAQNQEGTKDQTGATPITTRTARVKKNALSSAPVPPAKFRKRQIHKTWLPTHIYHAKRTHMTAPSEPLWRFSIPLTSTAKSYRPTHRAANERGAMAWDASYMSCISLEGSERSVQGVLKGLNVGGASDSTAPWGPKGQKWRSGTRVWQGWLYERDMFPSKPIAPATVIWRAEGSRGNQTDTREPDVSGKPATRKDRRQVLIRVHPSAFLQLWEQVMRLAKVQKPQVVAEDLRFEIGSIEITGPGSTEALISALRVASMDGEDGEQGSVKTTWAALSNVTNPAVLPANAMLAFDITDPRLHHPPRTLDIDPEEDPTNLYQILTEWPCDTHQEYPGLFDRKRRLAASRALPSQKAINRRKGLADPGSYPEPLAQDPRIPVLVYPTSDPIQGKKSNRGKQASWTVLLPWKAVLPVWQSLMYYPLSTGGQVRLGGLQERRQVAFESGSAWFPGDFPGTSAGKAWEVIESAKRKKEWERRPKGKRTEWSSVSLGQGRTGEIGDGCACDWEFLATKLSSTQTGQDGDSEVKTLFQMSSTFVRSLLEGRKPAALPTVDTSFGLATVRIVLPLRGVPSPCARIYRLPVDESPQGLRSQWLALDSSQSRGNGKADKDNRIGKPRSARGESESAMQQKLAADLLRAPEGGASKTEAEHPEVPGEEDLIGFVTTGEFCLTEGKGVAIGSVLIGKVMDGRITGGDMRTNRLCIVRNAGETVGRLAEWEVV